MREFLGLINFQRKFLPGCSEIQKPLSSLTGGRKNKVIEWSSEMTASFERLKSDMEKDIELAYPDYSEEAQKLELWVDASAKGAGAYLAQLQGDTHRVIGFASMTFTSTQLNYSTLERELTALRWGIKTFRSFLYGVSFKLMTDHQPLVHLHNMKIVCSRLARTVEELSDFVFEIHYVPGHLNTAADALSRVHYGNVESLNGDSEALPAGLVLDGPPSPGGGDSLFVSLYKCLTDSLVHRSVESVDGLRARLVGDLLKSPERYNLNLDSHSRKKLKLMIHPGQLPSLDVLLVASRLFEVKIFVYFWAKDPIIYQYENFSKVIHLQCISGIHFNALTELKSYCLPDPHQCAIGSSYVPQAQTKTVELAESDDVDDNLHVVNSQFHIDDGLACCDHEISSLPTIYLTFGQQKFCAILDSGAQTSLVSAAAAERISKELAVEVIHGYVCDIVGFSGEQSAITKSVEMPVKIAATEMKEKFKFAVVEDSMLPHCFLLGLDFMGNFDIGIDYRTSSCKQSFKIICPCISSGQVDLQHSVMIVKATEKVSHVLKIDLDQNDLRFSIQGESSVITGLSLLTNNDLVKEVQSRCGELKSLHKCLKDSVAPKNWPSSISRYRRFAKKLSICDGILVFQGNNVSIVLVPFSIVTELALTIHAEFAHLGRDKMNDLLYKLVWHPCKRTIISDVCTTCHTCQVTKSFGSPIVPPTLKIASHRPFELMAADLISLPRTSSGYVGCLVVVDHFSKWLVVVPIKNKKSSTIVEMLKNRVFPGVPAIPSVVLTDNGPEFTSKEFNDFLMDCGVTHKVTTPYCPSSNGAVERVNRTIQTFLRSIVTSGETWDQSLARAVISYNNTLHSELGMSPSNFILSKGHEVCSDPPLQSELKETWRLGHPKFLPFKVGQFVLMKKHEPGFLNVHKLSDKFDGPFKIVKVNDNGVTYQILNEGTQTIIRAHHSKLRFYKQAPKYIRINSRYKGPEISSEVNGPIMESTFRNDESRDVSFFLRYDSDSCTSDCESSNDDFYVCKPGKSAKSSSIEPQDVGPARTLKSPALAAVTPCEGCQVETSREEELRRVVDSSSSPPQHVVERSSRCSRSGVDVLTSITEIYSDVSEIADTGLNNCIEESFSGDEVRHDINYSLNSSSDWFTGFDEKEVFIRPVVDPVPLSGNDIGPRTRSRGAVPELPNVQPRTLERRRTVRK